MIYKFKYIFIFLLCSSCFHSDSPEKKKGLPCQDKCALVCGQGDYFCRDDCEDYFCDSNQVDNNFT